MQLIDLNNVQIAQPYAAQQSMQYKMSSYLHGNQAIDAFTNKIAEAGLGLQQIIADGVVHRFSTPSDTQGKLSGWYILFMDTIPAGQFGSWKEDISESFFAVNEFGKNSNRTPTILSEAEKKAFDAAMARAKLAREIEQKKLHDYTALRAGDLWQKAEDIVLGTTQSEYLNRKSVSPFGIKVFEKQILIPVTNQHGQLRNLQRIYQNGDKKFLYGGEIKGNFHFINGNTDTVYICEGYATGASLHMATGNAVMVAFNANNLMSVAKIVKQGMPNTQLVIAGDNDAFTQKKGVPWNVGLEKAHQAALETGATIVYPEFKNLTTKPTDFNDLHQLEGLEAVKIQSYISGDGPKIYKWGLELFEGKAPLVKWLVKDMLPLSAPCLLAATGGTGKGMLALDLALSIAENGASLINLNGENKWLGKEVVGSGSAVIFSAEDSKDTIHQRLESLDPTGERRAKARGNLFIIPLPNAGGPIQLVIQEGYGKGFKTTPAFENIKRQLRRIPNLKLINIDPLASFAGVDVNADPQAGAFIQGILANLAEETGACILISHHMSKPGKGGIANAETARNSVRGTSALIDGVRLALAIWQASTEKCVPIIKAYEKTKKYVKNSSVFEFAVVKSNTPADMETYTLLRGDNGLLTCVDTLVKRDNYSDTYLMGLLVESIRLAAELGRPFNKTGGNDPYNRREELPEELATLGRDKLRDLIQEALDNELVVRPNHKSSKSTILDVPTGQFADGTGIIEPGYTGDKSRVKNIKNELGTRKHVPKIKINNNLLE